jgi:hypothetical protein
MAIMTTQQSTGLKLLVQSDVAYAKRYAQVVHHVSTSAFAECKESYEGEFNSWKNRKAWAKNNNVAWDTTIVTFKGFLCACGPKPQTDHTLDRIDHKGPYLLANLRWASRKVQNNNKGNNVRICVGQELLTIADIANRSGKSYDSVRMGIYRHGEKWAASLLAHLSPAVAAEAAWQFPEDYRDELEALYKERTDVAQTRLLFFIKLARAEHTKYAHRACYSTTNAGGYQEIADHIKVIGNEAIYFYKTLYQPASTWIYERDGGYV